MYSNYQITMLKNKLQAVAVLGEQSKAAVRSLKQILKQHQKEIKTFKHQVLIFVKKKITSIPKNWFKNYYRHRTKTSIMLAVLAGVLTGLQVLQNYVATQV